MDEPASILLTPHVTYAHIEPNLLALPQGEMAAMFLRHEGFLGAMGAFLKVHPMGPTAERASTSGQPRKVSGKHTALTAAVLSCL